MDMVGSLVRVYKESGRSLSFITLYVLVSFMTFFLEMSQGDAESVIVKSCLEILLSPFVVELYGCADGTQASCT